MIQFRTLGTLDLRCSDRGELRALLSQPKRLALLAYLALAPRRTSRRRDTLVAMFWPELDQEHARGALRQALRGLRQALGPEGGLNHNREEALALDGSLFWCDVPAFEEACEAGRLPEALELYGGDLLPGLFASDVAPEFEQWLEQERARLRGRAASVAWSLAEQATERGDGVAAAAFGRRALTLTRDDEGQLHRLLSLLDRLGDRAGAVHAYEDFARQLRADYDVEPSAETQAFVTAIRDREAVRGAAIVVTPPPSAVADTTQAPVSVGPAARATSASSLARRTRWWLAAGALVVALALVVADGWVRSRVSASSRGMPLDADRLSVGQFQIIGSDTALLPLRETIVQWLRSRLPSDLHAASGVVEGDMARSGGEIIVNGRIRSAGDGGVRAAATVHGSADSVQALTTRLAATLLARLAGEREDRLTLLADAALPALRAYLAGQAAYRQGARAEAVAHFDRAITLDSGFALAGLQLAASTGWVFVWSVTGDSVIQAYNFPMGSGGIRQALLFQAERFHGLDVAWRNRARLGPADLAYLNAIRGSKYPEGELAGDIYHDWELAVTAAPDRADGWYRLGYVFLYQGLALGFPDAMDRAGGAFRHALELDPRFILPLGGLLEVAGRERDTASVRRLGAQYLARDSAGAESDYVRWHVAASLNDEAALRAVRARFDSLDLETLDRIQWTSQVEGIDLEDADRAMAVILRRTGEADERTIALFDANMLALNRGRPSEALRLAKAQAATQQDMGDYLHYRLVYGLYWDTDTAAAAEAAAVFARSVAPVLARSGPAPPDFDLTTVSDAVQWRLWHGDTTGADRALLLVEGHAAWTGNLAAILGVQLGRADISMLLDRLDSVTLLGCCNYPHFSDVVLARLRERTGDRAAALEAWRRESGFYAPEYLSTALREEGRLAELTGDTTGAIGAYRHYLALRSNPEPELQPEADRIRAALGRLERGRGGR